MIKLKVFACIILLLSVSLSTACTDGAGITTINNQSDDKETEAAVASENKTIAYGESVDSYMNECAFCIAAKVGAVGDERVYEVIRNPLIAKKAVKYGDFDVINAASYNIDDGTSCAQYLELSGDVTLSGTVHKDTALNGEENGGLYFELDKESASKLPSLIPPLFEAAGEDIQSDTFGNEAIRFYADQGSEFYDALNANSSSDSLKIKMTKFKLCYENFGTSYVGTFGIADSFEISSN